MQAIAFSKHGDLDTLEPMTLADPTPGPGEVIVAVKACALNRLDLWVRRGWPGLNIPLPHVLGSDISGVVVDVGPNVDVVEGMEVVLNPGVSCGRCRRCLAGEDNLCPEYEILGEHRWGGYAERVRVPAANLAPKPPGMGWAEAAALPLVFLTVWQMLVEKAQLRPGETILIHAGGSGVGSAAIQVAKLLGARIITTASSEEKLQRARDLGAHHGVRYDQDGWSRQVRKANGDAGVDVVMEHTGAATWASSLRCLRRGGRLVTCGATSGHEATMDLRVVFYRHLSIFGSTMGSKARLFEILKHVDAGDFAPIVDRTFPLAQAADAQRYLADRRQFGKVVLEVG